MIQLPYITVNNLDIEKKNKIDKICKEWQIEHEIYETKNGYTYRITDDYELLQRLMNQ